MSDELSAYLTRMNRVNRKAILRALVPEALWLLRRYLAYRRRFPGAAVSPHADVSLDARIAEGCVVEANCHLGPSVSLGRCTTLGPGVVARGAGRIVIGAFCSIAPDVGLVSENHETRHLTHFPLELYRDGACRRFAEFRGEDIEIGNDVWIGKRAMVLSGARIGTGCVVGAGSVVARGDYPPLSILVGMPARIAKRRFDEEMRELLLRSEWWLLPLPVVLGAAFDVLHGTDAVAARRLVDIRARNC